MEKRAILPVSLLLLCLMAAVLFMAIWYLRTPDAANPIQGIPIAQVAQPPDSSIGGIVRNEQGGPINGARVVLDWTDTRTHATHEVQVIANKDGRWTCADVQPESAAGLTEHVHLLGYSARDFTASLQSLASRSAEFVLPMNPQIGGVVADTAGKPITGATLMIWTPNMKYGHRPDASGRYLYLALVPTGPVSVGAHAKGYAPDWKTIDVTNGLHTANLTLVPGHSLRGKIIGTDGNTIAGASVTVDGLPPWFDLNYAAKTDAAGRFEISDLPAKLLHFHVNRAGYQSIKDATGTPGGADVTLTLNAGGG